MNTTTLILLACIAASEAATSLRGSSRVTNATSQLMSSNAVLYDGAFSMYGIDAHASNPFSILPRRTTEQVVHALQKLKSALAENGMSLAHVISLHILVADIKDWPAVKKILKSELPGVSLPAMSVVQAKFLDAAVKVQLDVEAASDPQLVQVTASEHGWTGQIGMDTTNGIAYLSGVLSPSTASSGSYGDQIAAIMPIIDAQLKAIGMDKNDLVMVTVHTETTPSATVEQEVLDLMDLNEAYNSAMAGTILPAMLTWYADAFAGSEAPGLQIMVTVTAARHRQTHNLTTPQLTAPVPVLTMTAPLFKPTPIQIFFPFSYVCQAHNSVWLTGQGYYGNSTDMSVATTAVMKQTLEKLQELDLGLEAVVTAQIIIVESGRGHVGELMEAYNSFLEAHAVTIPPTVSISVVASIDMNSPLEITITASKAQKTRIKQAA